MENADSEFSLSHEKGKETSMIEIVGETVASPKHPERNEDAIFIHQGIAAGVFDGMGGCVAGDVASRIASDFVREQISLIPRGLGLKKVEDRIKQILIGANEEVYREAQKKRNNMGTTASVVYIWTGSQGERKAIIGNVGDSRVYLLRDGQLRQITLDDGYVRLAYPNDEQAARQFQLKLNNVEKPEEELREGERAIFNQRNIITQYLGRDKITPRIHIVDVQPGDRLVLCSDGISDNLTDKEILYILRHNQDNTKAVNELISDSEKRSKDSDHPRHKPDDMSVVIIKVNGIDLASGLKEERQLPGNSNPSASEAKPIQDSGEIRVSSEVWVRRSNGKLDHGWVVEEILPDGNCVVVKTLDDGHPYQKVVPLAELERLNKPTTPVDISNANSIGDLCRILSLFKDGGVPGSQEFFLSEDLVEIIRRVEAGNLSIIAVPRTFGLRQKVYELLLHTFK